MENKKGKDPAFLLYSSDFLTGTMFMTDEQVGVYIRLLCVQHQHNGRINADAMQMQCSRITNGEVVMTKFDRDDAGYFNVRLEKEIEARAESSRRKSERAKDAASKRWNPTNMQTHCVSNADAMLTEDENEDEDENKNENKKVKKSVADNRLVVRKPKSESTPSSPESCLTYFSELGHPDQALKFFDYFSSNGWKVGGKAAMKDWKAAARNWCGRIIKPHQTEGRRVYGNVTDDYIRDQIQRMTAIENNTNQNQIEQ